MDVANAQYINDVIFFLYEKTTPTRSSEIYYQLEKRGNRITTPMNTIMGEIGRLELVEYSLIDSKVTTMNRTLYLMKEEVRREIKNLPAKYKHDPYGYFYKKKFPLAEAEKQSTPTAGSKAVHKPKSKYKIAKWWTWISTHRTLTFWALVFAAFFWLFKPEQLTCNRKKRNKLQRNK